MTFIGEIIFNNQEILGYKVKMSREHLLTCEIIRYINCTTECRATILQ